MDRERTDSPLLCVLRLSLHLLHRLHIQGHPSFSTHINLVYLTTWLYLFLFSRLSRSLFLSPLQRYKLRLSPLSGVDKAVSPSFSPLIGHTSLPPSHLAQGKSSGPLYEENGDRKKDEWLDGQMNREWETATVDLKVEIKEVQRR